MPSWLVPFRIHNDPASLERNWTSLETYLKGLGVRDHDLNDHTDVTVVNPADGYYLAWDQGLGQWVPRQSQAALGFAQFDYTFNTSTSGVPAPGQVTYDTADPVTTTVVYIHELDRLGDDQTLFLDNLKDGDWIDIHDPGDAEGRLNKFEVNGTPTKATNIYTVPVTFVDATGALLPNGFIVRMFLRFLAAPGFSGSHDDLTNVTPDQHHTRYDDAEAIAAVGPHTPPFTPSGLHDDLTDVSPDQHHAELHDLDSHVDVTAINPADGQTLTWDETTQRWVPRRSQSALGFVELDYRFDTGNDDTPAQGEIQYDNDDPALAVWMYVHEEDRSGNDETLFWDELKLGDWLNLHDPDDVDGRFQAFDVAGDPFKVGNIYHIPVTLFSQAGADFNNNFKIRVFVRYIAPPGFSGNHSDLSNVLPDDHHIRYSDQEAIDAVGDPGSGVYLPLAGGVMAGTITISDSYGVSFQNSTAGSASFAIDPNVASGATFRLRIGGSATAVNKFSIEGSGDNPIAYFTATGIRFDSQLDMGNKSIHNLPSISDAGDADYFLDGGINVATSVDLALSTTLTFKSSSTRVAQFNINKTGGRAFIRGIVDNGPVWQPWTELATLAKGVVKGTLHDAQFTSTTVVLTSTNKAIFTHTVTVVAGNTYTVDVSAMLRGLAPENSEFQIAVKINDRTYTQGMAGNANITQVSHTHTSASHNHSGPSHDHASANHSHSSAAHSHTRPTAVGGTSGQPNTGTSHTHSSGSFSTSSSTNSTTPGSTGSTTPNRTGNGGTANTGSTTPGATGSANPAAVASSVWMSAAAFGLRTLTPAGTTITIEAWAYNRIGAITGEQGTLKTTVFNA